MPDLVCVRSYRNRFEAEYAQSLLEAHDIPAIVMVDDCGGAEPDPVVLIGNGARVLVRADHAREAEKVLQGAEGKDA